jgi:hypothetical protein
MSNLLDIYIENESNLNNKISLSVQFWFYLISNILSIICCSLLLFYLLFNQTLRNAIHNHIIIILLFICLIYEIIDIPLILYNYRYELTSFLYRFWSFIDIGFYNTQLIIFGWSVIERHLIVFHEQWLKRRFYIHYLLPILLIIYCLIWYSITILFSFQHDSLMKYFDLIFHQLIPLLVIVIFSIGLVLRRLNESINDDKQRAMIFQILSISILYFLFNIPWIFVLICIQFDSLKHIGLIIMPYAYFFSYYFIFLFPFVCWTSLPEFQLKKCFR